MADHVTFQVLHHQYLDDKNPRGIDTCLFSGNLDLLKNHSNFFVKNNRATCQVCGKKYAFYVCTICNLHCCFKADHKMSSISCSISLHNDNQFGLINEDWKKYFGDKPGQYKKPNTLETKKNAAHVLNFMTNIGVICCIVFNCLIIAIIIIFIH